MKNINSNKISINLRDCEKQCEIEEIKKKLQEKYNILNGSIKQFLKYLTSQGISLIFILYNDKFIYECLCFNDKLCTEKVNKIQKIIVVY